MKKISALSESFNELLKQSEERIINKLSMNFVKIYEDIYSIKERVCKLEEKSAEIEALKNEMVMLKGEAEKKAEQ